MTILDIPEHSEAWHDVRLKHIGGSEIAGLFGVQEEYQQSAFTLFMVKSGRIPAPPVDDSVGSRIWFGTKLEPAIASLAAEVHGYRLAKGGYAIDDLCPGKAASLDFTILEPGPEEIKLGFEGPGAMQVKNIDLIQHKRKWVADEPPFSVLLQLQHDISSAGYSWGCIAGLIGGNEIAVYRYAARDKTISLIRQRVTEFWRGVRERKPPIVDGTNSTADALAVMFPVLAGDLPVDLTTNNEASEICAGFLVAQADAKGAEANLQNWKNRLRELMGSHKRAVCNGFAINGVFTAANEGTPAGDLPADQIIGKRAASAYFKVREIAA